MSRYYDRSGQPIGQMEWIAAMEAPGRAVEQTSVGESLVSTVWLGLDHQFGDGPPLIFETMIFGGTEDGWGNRYSTEERARAGHAAAVAWIKGEGDQPR